MDRKLHEPEHTVEVTLTLKPGAQFHFGRLTIKGLDILSEPVIRKMWGGAPDKPYPDGYPDAFLDRVKEEGIFDNLGKMRAETDIVDASKTVDVTLYFAGADPKPSKRTR